MENELAACPVCGVTAAWDARHPEADLYRCPSCDHCFSLGAVPESLEQYDEDYYLREHERWFSNPHIALFEQLRSVVRRMRPDADLLDVGCGKGDFLKYLSVRSPALRLTGIDWAPNSPAGAITYLQGDYLTYVFERRFDVIVSMAVIEHVPDVQAFVRKAEELCAEDGMLILTTVNERGLLYRSARLLKRMGVPVAFNRLYSKHHVHHFTVASLRRLLERNGWRVAETIMHNIPMAAVDVPKGPRGVRFLLRGGVWSAFALGRLGRSTFLQTVVCRKGR